MKLKPCPFCGGEAQINERYRSGTANRKMYWISCKACGISQMNHDLAGYRYQSKAIDRWNRREPMDKIVEQLEKELYRGMESLDPVLISFNFGINKAIEIVKGGA